MFVGRVKKLQSEHSSEGSVQYKLPIGNECLSLNRLLGKKITLKATGNISCIECGRKIKKTYNQGLCFPCCQVLPQADLCQVKPEICHFNKGTCRDPHWAEKFCFIDHTVYLAISSDLKVGITRSFNQTNRWIDQGAVQALPIARVATRFDSGLVEVALKEEVNDKTNWRAMLKGEHKEIDLYAKRSELFGLFPSDVNAQKLENETIRSFIYPVIEYPKKVISLNFTKDPLVTGILMGIKGQYLIFDTGVLNIRKFSGYEIDANFSE
ncbi:MAG: DUF2797 domain-containing protein [Oligoflexales bacterium]